MREYEHECVERGNNLTYWEAVTKVINDSAAEIDEFLISDQLWGGSGSIADQALTCDPKRRKALEVMLIRLGRIQADISKTNPRTVMWTNAFAQWQSTAENRQRQKWPS